MRNDGTHILSNQSSETSANSISRLYLRIKGYLLTCWNKRKFASVGEGFLAPNRIHVVNGKNIFLGDNVFLGEHCQLYAYPDGEIHIGHNSSIDRFVEVRGGKKIIILNDVRIVKGSTLKCPDNSIMSIGHRTILSQGCILDGGIKVGNDVTFGPNVFVNDEDHGFSDVSIPINQQTGILAETIIEDDCWIANGAMILKGVTLAKGAVIGAGSVVNRNVPAYSINVGVPSKTIKYRTSISKGI